MASDRVPDAPRLSDDVARRLLARAAELDDGRASGTSPAVLREVARESGIAPEAFDAALAEMERAPDVAAPLWVRACLTGVPDRRSAMGFYALFIAALCGAPALALADVMAWPAAGAFSAFCGFAAWSTGCAVRWADRHGWSRLP